MSNSSLKPVALSAAKSPEAEGEPAPSPEVTGVVGRVRGSVWAPVVLKLGAIAFGMLGLAGIGTASILSGQQGVKIAPNPPLSADIGTAWIAATRDAEAPPKAADSKNGCGHGGQLCSGDAGAKRPHGITKDGKVILNVASAEELTRLPGVGKKRAESIVKLRTRLKRFRRTTDLLRVRGIGVRSLKRMLPHLVLDPPKPEDAG